MRLLPLIAMLACSGSKTSDEVDPTDTTTEETGTTDSPIEEAVFVNEPAVQGPASEEVGVVRVLTASLDREATLLVEATDDLRGETLVYESGPAEAHDLTLFGHPAGAEVSVEITATPTDGGPELVYALTFSTPALPDAPMPLIERVVHDPEAVEPGYTLFSMSSTITTVGTLILNRHGDLVWWHIAPITFADVTYSPEGTLIGMFGGGLTEMSLRGEVVHRLDTVPGELEAGRLHHELYPASDGTFWGLGYALTEIVDFPQDYDDPTDVRTQIVADNTIVQFDRDGTTLSSTLLSDLLDPTRLNHNTLDIEYGFPDWAHANAVVPLDEGGVLVSVRHQDVVMKLTAAGEVEWLLGDPRGWSSPWVDQMLTPVGELKWPYHQHAPEVLPSGEILLFDNHNNGAPLGEEPGVEISRVVAYEVSGTSVSESLVLEQTALGPLYSHALGDADYQPLTGNILGVWGMVDEENGIDNNAQGWGDRTAHLVEFDPAGNVVSHFRLRSDGEVDPRGWSVYRAERFSR